jgi:hypothetical protein
MGVLTPAQQSCHTKVSGWIEQLFSQIPWEKLDEPGFGLFLGSAWVEVRILPWKDDAVINIRSTVVSGAEQTPKLLKFLLRQNAELLFGAFSLDKDGNIQFEHTIVGSTCDINELKTSVLEVLAVADEYDDQIVERWGGDRALDRKL